MKACSKPQDSLIDFKGYSYAWHFTTSISLVNEAMSVQLEVDPMSASD